MTEEKGYRYIFAQWIPLALSWLMISVASPIVNAGISRLPNPAVNLAAYGVTMDIAVLIESPIIMILSTSVALVRGSASYALIRRFVTHVTIAQTILAFLVFYTPLYNPIMLGIVGVPVEVAEAARPALQMMLFWPISIGWRRFYQGMLISHGKTRFVSYGTMFRLGTLIVGVLIGLALGLPGAVMGGFALAASVFIEAVVIIIWTLPLVREKVLTVDDGRPMSYWGLYRFYLPLAATDLMRVLTRPVAVAGIARAAESTLSLAAWPPGLGLSSLLSSSLMGLQEIVVAQGRGSVMHRRIAIFALSVGAILTAIQALIAFTPLADWYFRRLIGVPAAVEALTLPIAQILTLYPLLLSARSYGRGILISRRQSSLVQNAMLGNLVALIVVMTLGVWFGPVTGAYLAAWGTLLAQAVEVAMLQWFATRPAPEEIRHSTDDAKRAPASS